VLAHGRRDLFEKYRVVELIAPPGLVQNCPTPPPATRRIHADLA